MRTTTINFKRLIAAGQGRGPEVVHCSPVLLLCRRMIEAAVADAGLFVSPEGEPDREIAVPALAWLVDRNFEPGGFDWACRALSEDPELRRKVSLRQVWRFRQAIVSGKYTRRTRFQLLQEQVATRSLADAVASMH